MSRNGWGAMTKRRDGMRAVVIGVLDDGPAGLDAAARAALARAELVVGGARLLALLDEALPEACERFDLSGRLAEVPDRIRRALAEGRRVAVLATGDPMCHGIGAWLARKLGSDALEIRPNLSAVQLASARLGIGWEDARICSVHGRDAGEWAETTRGRGHGLYPLFRACLDAEKIIAFTSAANGPARIARMLVHEGWGECFRMQVCENLRRADERVVTGAPAELVDRSFAATSMVVLLRVRGRPKGAGFGLADEAYLQRKPEKGLITKREVRALSLALMELAPESIVWDIGAGSGSVGLEAARLCPEGWVFAIEKNAADAAIARENQRRLDVHPYTLVHGRAPDGLDAWPDPDAVFIGGSGGELPELIRIALARLRPGGRLVMNLVTLENLAAALAALRAQGAEWRLTQLAAARSAPILHMHRLRAENPVWIVQAWRRGEDACVDD